MDEEVFLNIEDLMKKNKFKKEKLKAKKFAQSSSHSNSGAVGTNSIFSSASTNNHIKAIGENSRDISTYSYDSSSLRILQPMSPFIMESMKSAGISDKSSSVINKKAVSVDEKMNIYRIPQKPLLKSPSSNDEICFNSVPILLKNKNSV